MARKLQIIGKFPSGGEVDPSDVKAIVDDYLEENPPAAPRITINGKEPDENGNFTINVPEDMTNNVVEF